MNKLPPSSPSARGRYKTRTRTSIGGTEEEVARSNPGSAVSSPRKSAIGTPTKRGKSTSRIPRNSGSDSSPVHSSTVTAGGGRRPSSARQARESLDSTCNDDVTSANVSVAMMRSRDVNVCVPSITVGQKYDSEPTVGRRVISEQNGNVKAFIVNTRSTGNHFCGTRELRSTTSSKTATISLERTTATKIGDCFDSENGNRNSNVKNRTGSFYLHSGGDGVRSFKDRNTTILRSNLRSEPDGSPMLETNESTSKTIIENELTAVHLVKSVRLAVFNAWFNLS